MIPIWGSRRLAHHWAARGSGARGSNPSRRTALSMCRTGVLLWLKRYGVGFNSPPLVRQTARAVAVPDNALISARKGRCCRCVGEGYFLHTTSELETHTRAHVRGPALPVRCSCLWQLRPNLIRRSRRGGVGPGRHLRHRVLGSNSTRLKRAGDGSPTPWAGDRRRTPTRRRRPQRKEVPHGEVRTHAHATECDVGPAHDPRSAHAYP